MELFCIVFGQGYMTMQLSKLIVLNFTECILMCTNFRKSSRGIKDPVQFLHLVNILIPLQENMELIQKLWENKLF